MSRSKEAYWDSHPCAECDEAPSLLGGSLCEGCNEEMSEGMKGVIHCPYD